ncbi:hypothetical protein KIN20_021200 [Parelaphostrongylus tenuis]|uniref:Uncharacterized protein n=1 Tax=Parelaphostrongylus tenuis TaxID=148309 RepID=A0AAD5MNK2_PARTN|nr:hypothetical protein KIN20_021200 [Parelaphostrongylus tenuis]
MNVNSKFETLVEDEEERAIEKWVSFKEEARMNEELMRADGTDALRRVAVKERRMKRMTVKIALKRKRWEGTVQSD